MTVSGFAMTSVDRQSAQTSDNDAQKQTGPPRSASATSWRIAGAHRSDAVAPDLHLGAMRERKTEDSVRRNGDRTLDIDLASHFGDVGNLMLPE
jgi:hypothetical protein